MEGDKFKRTIGGILLGVGLLLLLFAVAAFMSSTGTVMGFDVVGIKKIAPALLGIILLVGGMSMINRT